MKYNISGDKSLFSDNIIQSVTFYAGRVTKKNTNLRSRLKLGYMSCECWSKSKTSKYSEMRIICYGFVKNFIGSAKRKVSR